MEFGGRPEDGRQGAAESAASPARYSTAGECSDDDEDAANGPSDDYDDEDGEAKLEDLAPEERFSLLEHARRLVNQRTCAH